MHQNPRSLHSAGTSATLRARGNPLPGFADQTQHLNRPGRIRRNVVAYGLGSPDLFGRGPGNWVVHTMVLLGGGSA
jgi:hypothetical protein